MKTFAMPDLGEGLAEAEIVAWHVSVGDRVIADQPLVSVETDKAVVEIPAPWSGTVVKFFAEPGNVIKVGAPLAEFDLGEGHADAGAIVGTLPLVVPEHEQGPVREEAVGVRVKAAPAVRERAKTLGVDISDLKGSGPDGAITLRDVEMAAGPGQASRHSKQHWQPLRGVRRSMARNMERAHAIVATTTVTDEANISHWPADRSVTVELMRAIAAACAREPALNAWYDGEREARLIHDQVDLGIAVNTDEGLFVPVMRDIANRSAVDLAHGLETLKADVIARTVPPVELKGQTITLSNFGMAGGRNAVLVVMPPQVAILGAGRITLEPRCVEGEIKAARVLPLSLTFDHRAVTGVEATRFLMAVVKSLEA